MTHHAPTIDPADDLLARIEEVRNGRRSARERTEDSLKSIDRVNGDLNAFHETLAETAPLDADRIDEAIRAGKDPGPLAGAIIAVKDNICTTAGRTTCSSRRAR